MRDLIYLDNGATTPTDPAVMRAMVERQATLFGNPSSKHPVGRRAARAIDAARGRLARMMGADPAHLVFTGGGTEAAGLAIMGSAGASPARIAISAVEHPCIRKSAEWLRDNRGWTVDVIPVDETGRVDPDVLAETIGPRTRIVAIMLAQNEVGAINDLKALAPIVRHRAPKARLVVDAVQAFARIPISVSALDVDCLVATAHKLHGPHGVGVLYSRQPLRPILEGGGQEGGRRGGTQSAPLVMAFADAAETQYAERAHLSEMRDRLWSGLRARLPGLILSGPEPGPWRLPHNLHICVPGVPAEPLLNTLAEHGICVSAGSACGGGAFSSTLAAMGRRAEDGAYIRLTTGRFTTADEIDTAVSRFAEAVSTLRVLCG